MQLILVIALFLMYGGRGGVPANKILDDEAVELIKYISDGDENVGKIIRQVEEATELISAFAPLMNMDVAKENPPEASDCTEASGGNSDAPLKPIVNIADATIYSALSCAIS